MKKAGEGIRTSERKIEREGVRFRNKRATAEGYASWLRQVNWNLFCTFTFAWKVSDRQADKTFSAFINRLECSRKSVVGYIRGDEKRFSGCGKPACGRHYHALLTSCALLKPSFVESLWMQMAGNRSDHAGAKVKLYDPAQNGVEYILKFINETDGDWKHSRLELFHPESKSAHIVNARWRRRLRHLKAAEEKKGGNNCQQPATKTAIVCNGAAT